MVANMIKVRIVVTNLVMVKDIDQHLFIQPVTTLEDYGYENIMVRATKMFKVRMVFTNMIKVRAMIRNMVKIKAMVKVKVLLIQCPIGPRG